VPPLLNGRNKKRCNKPQSLPPSNIANNETLCEFLYYNESSIKNRHPKERSNLTAEAYVQPEPELLEQDCNKVLDLRIFRSKASICRPVYAYALPKCLSFLFPGRHSLIRTGHSSHLGPFQQPSMPPFSPVALLVAALPVFCNPSREPETHGESR
jgi:hypothetical protein